jgi:protein deglycase|tara:strand:- start:180 stop:728 length:549 start_codon:yes stop_codon:yes gene_type:complete
MKAMSKVLAILAEGFEEIEAITPIDLLRRAGVEVTLAALEDGKHVTGKMGITLHADANLSDLNSDDYDCVFLPGGPGVKHLRASDRVIEIVLKQHASKRLLAAICAAPTVLHDAGVLTDKRYTAHFSVGNELAAILSNEKVMLDGNVLTSRGAGTALEFGLVLVEQLVGDSKSKEVSDSICV